MRAPALKKIGTMGLGRSSVGTTLTADIPEGNLLTVRDMFAGYKGVSVLHGINCDVQPGEIVGLLGPNGAGKTTLLRTMSGLLKSGSGSSVAFEGREISRLKPYERARMGISFIPERGGTFAPLTVEENLRAGSSGINESQLEMVREVFPELTTRWGHRASMLSGGERQMLSLARAFLAKPTLLLVDEISTGLAPKIVAKCFHHMQELRASGTAIIVVDQYVDRIIELADRLLVLSRGHVVYSGKGDETDAEKVWRYYLT